MSDTEPIMQKDHAEIEFRVDGDSLSDFRRDSGELEVYPNWVRVDNHVIPRRRVEVISW